MSESLTEINTGMTYDRLIRDIDRREIPKGSVEQNWNNYIDIARGLLSIAENARMAVAEIAMRATVLRSGGDRHSLNWKTVGSRLTMKAFANSIGVKPNTLLLWVNIKRHVFDHLTKQERIAFKHDSGERTYKMIGAKSNNAEKARVFYKAISGMSKEQKAAVRSIQHVMCLRKVFRKYVQHLNNKQVLAIKISVLEILKTIEELPKP